MIHFNPVAKLMDDYVIGKLLRSSISLHERLIFPFALQEPTASARC
jgi:hypothetical protein